MKKLICLAVAAAMALCACANRSGQVSIPDPVSIANRVCPSIEAVGSVLMVPGALDPEAQAGLAVAAPVVGAVCSAGAGIKIDDIHKLAHEAVPLFVKAVAAAAIPPEDKQAALLGIAVVQAALAPLVQ